MGSADKPVVLEVCEHFPKQTYRNRATIATPNGRLDLVVPVVKGSKVHTRVRDVRISNEFRWQRQHWMSLQTAYRSSPWFEFYEDELAPFYERSVDFLFDYNESLFQKLMHLLKIKLDYTYTSEYIRPGDVKEDYRESLHPKKPAGLFMKPYSQVFEERNGFLPNLSIVDVLFSKGPESGRFIIHGQDPQNHH